MKNIMNKKYLILIVLSLIISASCSKWIDEDINIDPDSPSDVPMNLLLPAIQQSMGYNLLGNNSVRTNNIWMQMFDGTDRQSFTEARYQLTPADVNNLWVSTYTEMFQNSTILINKAIESESPNIQGVSEVLIATTLGISTDLFGDMPFSQAFKGNQSILKPEYDSQQKLYDTLFTILDRAIVNLNNSNNAISISGDVIYGGDTGKWVKAANSIKARHALQLSGVNGNAAYTQALAAVSNGFTSNSDDFLVPFENANRNPIYQFMEDRTDIRMGATLVDMMANNGDDPRLPFYAAQDGDGNYTGSIPVSENSLASYPGTYNSDPESPTILMSYTELKFIEAECRLMLGQGGAQQAYEDAVAASVLRVTGSANTAWLDAYINGIPVTLQSIIEQKYIANYSTNQPYADYRRTGFPVLTIPAGTVLPAIPTRFPYSQNELDFNTENLPTVVISDKLWWDQ
jgi:SusD/RagB-like outer membrane lipoprotein